MNQQDLTSISRDIAAVASSLSNEETGVKPLLFKANQLLHEAEKLEIRETIVKLNNILTKLESGPLYKHINQTIVDLDKLIVDLRTYPSRYVNFSIFGRNSTLGKRYKKTNELPSTPPSSQPTTPSTSMKNKANNKKK
jgi:phospholipid/cholesterol/gamma-HCH transport system substrate-binding protein